MRKLIVLILLIVLSLNFSTSIHAEWSSQKANDCQTLCGAWDFQLQGGVEPLFWRNRGGIFGENAVIDGSPANRLFSFDGGGFGADPTVIIQGQCIPKFSRFFDLPWMAGGQVGYSRHCWRLFGELNYAQAKAKSPCKTQLLVFSSTGAPAGTTLNFTLNNYRFVDAYLGAQYIFATICNLDFFIGAKIGFIYHLKSNFGLTQTIPIEGQSLILDLVPVCPKTAFIEKSVACAGGALLGLNYAVCDNWFLSITGEIVANRGPKTNGNIPVNIPNIPTLRVFFGPIKSEIRVPIMLSLRHVF